jgi:hypothetical protein
MGSTGGCLSTGEALRNLAFGLIRHAGYTKIASTSRKIKHNPRLLLAILGRQNTA